MPKDQVLATKPDQTEERLHSADVPSIGTPAPPINPADVPGLMPEKPKLKRKNNATLTPLIIMALVIAMIIAGVMSTVIVERRTSPAVVIVGDGRIEPPQTLPNDTSPKGEVSEKWQPASVSPLAWDTWSIIANTDDTYTISVNPISPDFTPILGLYDSDGRLVVAASTDRTAPQKALEFKFAKAGTYTVLVSNIGGTAGSYEIMSQLRR